MEDLFVILGWGSPIGLGIFFVCGGVALWFLRKSDTKKD
jgi:hypothetical protein